MILNGLIDTFTLVDIENKHPNLGRYSSMRRLHVQSDSIGYTWAHLSSMQLHSRLSAHDLA